MTTARGERPEASSAHDVAPRAVFVPDHEERCLNCETALVGPYCAACGQRALPPRPTVRELAEEAWQEFVSLDGKVAATLRLLIARPGELTAQALAGRRARFVGPVRLYLLCSLAFFVVSTLIPKERFGERRRETRATVARTAGVALPKSCQPTSGRPHAVVAQLRALDCKTDRDPARFDEARKRNVPRLMFLLLPLYAAILAMVFRGRTFPEHLYFALHLHAFVFLALLPMRGTDLLPSRQVEGLFDVAVCLWVVSYSVLALRRVYGGRWRGVIARSVAIGTLYFTAVFIGLVLTVLVTAWQM